MFYQDEALSAQLRLYGFSKLVLHAIVASLSLNVGALFCTVIFHLSCSMSYAYRSAILFGLSLLEL